MAKNVLIPMADGAEDLELVSIIDVFKRAKAIGADVNVICASLKEDKHVTMDSGTVILAETTLGSVDLKSIDAVVLHGGFNGSENFKKDERIIGLLKSLNEKKKTVAAFCASPGVLWEAGVLSNEFSCYPGCEHGIRGTRLKDAVTVRDNIITGAGPAVVITFALTILKEMGFSDQADDLADGLLASVYGLY